MEHRRKKVPASSILQKKSEVERRWFLLDAEGKTLGRFASEAARILRGKHKPTYTPWTDGGDGVIIINAEKIQVTGNKGAQKMYRHHSGYPGGQREIPYNTMIARKPAYVLEHAIKGMVPRTKLGRAQMKRLRIFAGTEHKMPAQTPILANI